MTQPYETNTFTAGIKMSKSLDTASVVLLEWTGQDCSVVYRETLTCSNNLHEVMDRLEHHLKGAEVTIAAGVDSSVLRYLTIQIPPVDEHQQHDLLNTQAEAKLPLSADQMTLAWQISQSAPVLQCNTAVIRKELLRPILHQSDRIQAICPEAVGLAAVWKRYGVSDHQRCTLLYRREQDLLTAYVQNGHVHFSSVIDADGADLQNGSPAGLLLHDIQTELESIESDIQEKTPVVIVSETPADDFLKQLCTQIQSLGWRCESDYLKDFPELDKKVRRLESFGLALAAKTDTSIDFDFRAAEHPGKTDQKESKSSFPLIKAVAATLGLLLLVWATGFWKIKKDVALMGKVMSSSHEDVTVQQVLKEQAYRETIARARPDMMDLFSRIQKCQKDILLDAFEFEKGKPVKVTATARSYDAAYAFQKELEEQNKNVIKAVQLLEPRMDAKGNKVRFTLRFHYKNFSK